MEDGDNVDAGDFDVGQGGAGDEDAKLVAKREDLVCVAVEKLCGLADIVAGAPLAARLDLALRAVAKVAILERRQHLAGAAAGDDIFEKIHPEQLVGQEGDELDAAPLPLQPSLGRPAAGATTLCVIIRRGCTVVGLYHAQQRRLLGVDGGRLTLNLGARAVEQQKKRPQVQGHPRDGHQERGAQRQPRRLVEQVQRRAAHAGQAGAAAPGVDKVRIVQPQVAQHHALPKRRGAARYNLEGGRGGGS